MADLSMLVNKVLSDKDFAQGLLNDPEGTLRKIDIEPTAEIIEALKGLDLKSLQDLAAAFGKKGVAL